MPRTGAHSRLTDGLAPWTDYPVLGIEAVGIPQAERPEQLIRHRPQHTVRLGYKLRSARFKTDSDASSAGFECDTAVASGQTEGV